MQTCHLFELESPNLVKVQSIWVKIPIVFLGVGMGGGWGSGGGGGGGGTPKNFDRGVPPGFLQPYPSAMETEGQNHILGYGKCVKIKPLTIGNITKLTTFEAILHEIGQIWPKFCHLLKKNGGIRSKWPKFAENIPLAMEPQPKLATEI